MKLSFDRKFNRKISFLLSDVLYFIFELYDNRLILAKVIHKTKDNSNVTCSIIFYLN